ncbi:MAG: potassium channel family protein [Gammaproteobacteria bacterium]
MNSILFLVLRRMRVPLLVLSTTYAAATLGFALIPGVDAQGNPWRMDFFHAFYFVSYMGTTIGFGEIPYPFSEAQRLWATVCIYLTVIAWVYAIGAVLTLLQDEALRQAFTERRFARNVGKLREPFFLVCGYGDTGSALVEALERHWIQSVVIEIKQERINALILSNYPMYVPNICADAAYPGNLLLAGLRDERCAGVVALTDQNKVNLHIAITAKVFNPSLKVICRAESHDVEANMASFGTDYIIDPFDTFAEHLVTALYSPCQSLLASWLAGDPSEPLEESLHPPRGLWVLCGYGRFGKAMYRCLTEQGIPLVVIEPYPAERQPPDGSVAGWGTDADTLRQAGIEQAVGIVAGTDDDSNNLSIIMTARQLNSDLFLVVRQNQQLNQALFESAGANVVMQASRVVANRIRGLITIPLLENFLQRAMAQDEQWTCVLISRLAAICDDKLPEVWQITLDQEQAYAVHRALQRGDHIELEHLLTDPRDRSGKLFCIPLLLVNSDGTHLLPEHNPSLQAGDHVLFAGSRTSRSRLMLTLQNEVALAYVTTGRALPQSTVWRLITHAFGNQHRNAQP